jgi:hypothetical protein
MTRSLPRRVHRNLPRAAPPDSWRSLRSAWVPPMHYLDKLHRPSLGAMGGSGFDRRNATKLGQNSSRPAGGSCDAALVLPICTRAVSFAYHRHSP